MRTIRGGRRSGSLDTGKVAPSPDIELAALRGLERVEWALDIADADHALDPRPTGTYVGGPSDYARPSRLRRVPEIA